MASKSHFSTSNSRRSTEPGFTEDSREVDGNQPWTGADHARGGRPRANVVTITIVLRERPGIQVPFQYLKGVKENCARVLRLRKA